ncbi:MAG: hypothetical protein HKN08_02520 [Gammaproteobacteria bacterium]|nr:hypothetical protein [Gammaproteobacteria bacterium]
MTIQPNKEKTSQDSGDSSEMSQLNEIYHKLDVKQDRLLHHWLEWSQTKVIGNHNLSVIYCLVALTFMLVFAFTSFIHEHFNHAKVLLVFCFMTVCNLVFLIVKNNERLSNTMVVILFGALCIYLFVTGGINQTGPLWYFVYPLTALFILNLWEGLLMTVLLFWATMMIYSIQVINIDYDPYPGSFVARFFSVYIVISMLSFLYAYNRSKNDLMHRDENKEENNNYPDL